MRTFYLRVLIFFATVLFKNEIAVGKVSLDLFDELLLFENVCL